MKKKHTNVGIIAELQKLVDSHVDSYKEDFDIDKRIIRCAAESKEPEDKVLMWFCRPHGTHCLRENQVFIQGTKDHNTYRFYAEQTHDECIARVIVPKKCAKARCTEMCSRSITANRRQMWRRTLSHRTMTVLLLRTAICWTLPAAAALMQQWLWLVSMAASKHTGRSRRMRMLWRKC